MRLCKILRAGEAVALIQSKVFAGSADDVRDGYIHLSTEEQMAGTLAKHFFGQSELMVALCDEQTLGPALKWEPSRGGALFPHLYRDLQWPDIKALFPIPDDQDGWTLPAL